MLRELPETELPDDRDYERWYFECNAQGKRRSEKWTRRESRMKTDLASSPSERHEKRYDEAVVLPTKF